MNTLITPDAALEMARRGRGAARIANSRLTWTRPFATSEADGRIDLDIARAALDMAEVDRNGLDEQARRYLEKLIDLFGGGPTGVEALAATMSIASDTLSDEEEPYLLRGEFITRTPRGRQVMPKAYRVLGRAPKSSGNRDYGQRSLFGEE